MKYAAALLLLLLASCSTSGKSPTSLVAATPVDTTSLIVSTDPADHPDFLCDGTNDEVEINLAIQRADSSTGWTVRLMPGIYHVQRGIGLLSKVTLRGSGATTVIRLDDNAPSMATVAGIVRIKAGSPGAHRREHVTLEDFVVDGNRAHQAPDDNDKKFGIYSEGDFITLRRLVVRDCTGYGFDPHAADDSIPSQNLLIEDCEAFGNLTDGFALDGVMNSTVRRNYAHDNDRHGFNLVTGSSAVTLTDNRAVHNGATGLMAQNGTHDVVIQSCEVADNALQGMFLRDADGSMVLGNTFTANRRSGLLLRLTDHATISDNKFAESDTGAIGRAVVLLDSVTVALVSSNTITSTSARQGVLEAGTSDYNQVVNNIIYVHSRHVVLIGPHSTQSGNQFYTP